MIVEVPEIMEILPHRYPMLFVDRIIELEPMKYAVGIKNVTINEPFFVGHFPGKPIMPGIVLCESMAQVGGIALLYPEENRGLIPMFTAMDKVRFRSPVTPGDTLRMTAEITKVRGITGKVSCHAHVGDTLKAEADFMFFLAEQKEEQRKGEK